MAKRKCIISSLDEIRRKPIFKSETRICSLCGALIYTQDDWINHFRDGDEKHRLEYLDAMGMLKYRK